MVLIDIGKEDKPFVIEPLEEPVPGREQAPEPEPLPERTETPEREPVPA